VTGVQTCALPSFELRDDRSIVSADSYDYRRRCLEGLFRSLFLGRSVLVLDEASGFYPALVHRAGARAVTAANVDTRTCELIEEVSRFLEVEATVLRRQLLGFYEGEPYVDMEFKEAHEFLLALGQIWPMFGASGESLDAIAEACAFFVTSGVVFDWTDASWASPGPPPEYNLDALCAALRRKFEFVIVYGGWLVVAAGKLPETGSQDDDDELLDGMKAPSGSVGPSHYALQYAGPASYEEFVPVFREIVCRALPPESTVIVVSRGDPEMVALDRRTAWHFPRGDDGGYAGYHPSDGNSAIAHLEALRAEGAQFVVFPQPSFWWLEYYEGFRDHLEREHELVLQDPSCVIYALRETTGRSHG
jgi:hypothetical protein